MPVSGFEAALEGVDERAFTTDDDSQMFPANAILDENEDAPQILDDAGDADILYTSTVNIKSASNLPIISNLVEEMGGLSYLTDDDIED